MQQLEKLRSPTLQTVLMVEKFIEKHSGDYKKTSLLNNLPKQVMWSTFQVILDYLEENGKIGYDCDGWIIYIWNPKMVAKYWDREDLAWNPK